MATTPTTHAVVPCALSLLSLAMPHLPHSHKCHASLHSHTWRALCGSSHPHTHTHTGWLTAHTPSTHHHHWVCVCSSTCSHPPHTHGTHRRGPCMGGCWCGHHHHAPCAPPSHTHTAGLVVWAMVVLGGARVSCVCLPRHHHTRLPSHHHHQRSCATTALTHTRDLVHAPLPHTRHMHHHTHQGVLCVDHTMPHPPPPTPSPHSHTHHMAHTHGISHTATMVLAIAHHAVHSHTQLMPHTHHTGDRPRPSTPLAVAFREPPPPRWSCPFALLSSSLLVHQPLFSLSSMHSHAPHVLITTTMPSIPCVCCVCGGDGQHQAPQWW